MRTMNRPRFEKWLKDNGPMAMEDLAYRTRIKFFTLRKIVRGEKKPSELEQKALCEGTGLLRDELFPFAKEKSIAS